jgi:hypothetical protein
MPPFVAHTVTAALLLSVQLAAPHAAAQTGVERDREALIYGEDSRAESRAHPDPALRELSRSVVALVQRSAIHIGEDGVELTAPRLAQAFDLCNEERFLDQPVLADCSGVLVADDLVLTAGHCVDSAEQCRNLHVVLDYAVDAAGEVTLERNKIHSCAGLVARELSNIALPEVFDYALLRIEPRVEGVLPASVRSAPLSQGDSVVLIGHGLGLPTKIDEAARVIDPRRDVQDYFGAQFDLFHRGSGSGVFDAAGKLAGIAVRGGSDFDGDGACVSLRRVPTESSAIEEASYAHTALARAGFAQLLSEEIGPAESAAHADGHASCSFSPSDTPRAYALLVGLSVALLRRGRRRPINPNRKYPPMRNPS